MHENGGSARAWRAYWGASPQCPGEGWKVFDSERRHREQTSNPRPPAEGRASARPDMQKHVPPFKFPK